MAWSSPWTRPRGRGSKAEKRWKMHFFKWLWIRVLPLRYNRTDSYMAQNIFICHPFKYFNISFQFKISQTREVINFQTITEMTFGSDAPPSNKLMFNNSCRFSLREKLNMRRIETYAISAYSLCGHICDAQNRRDPTDIRLVAYSAPLGHDRWRLDT